MSLDTSKLPPETAALWKRCESELLLAGSFLLGGTALALQIQHRISEDLDFFFTTTKLPCEKIDAFLNNLREEGKQLEKQTHWPTYDEFQNAGDNMYNYHQVWLVDEKTKMSFTTFGQSTVRLLHTPSSSLGPVVPTTRELFDTKAVLVSQRIKSRDWLDLYILMRDQGFTVTDFCAAYDKAGYPGRGEEELEKLAKITNPKGDEGYRALITPAPTIEDMRNFLQHKKIVCQKCLNK